MPTLGQGFINHLLARCADRKMGHRAMPGLSLREAAKQVNVSKSTILRAVRSGRMSAARTEDGEYSIDPAELFRVYEPKCSDS
jgi:excisionase family DNA binding protein